MLLLIKNAYIGDIWDGVNLKIFFRRGVNAI